MISCSERMSVLSLKGVINVSFVGIPPRPFIGDGIGNLHFQISLHTVAESECEIQHTRNNEIEV